MNRRARATKRAAQHRGNGKAPVAADLQEVEDFLQEVEAVTRDEPTTVEERVAEASAELRGESDPEARWIAAGFGQPVSSLRQAQAPRGSCEDEGQTFYTVSLSGITLALSHDGLCAYLIELSDDAIAEGKLEEICERHGLTRVDASALDISKAFRPPAPWLKVAEGECPVSGKAERIEYLHPGQPGHSMSSETLSLMSMELYEVLHAEALDEASVKQTRGLAVCPGEVLARMKGAEEGKPGKDVFGRPISPSFDAKGGKLEAGLNVALSADGEFKSERYGYICLLEGRLSVLSPLWIDEKYMCLSWLVLDEDPQPLTPEMIRQCMQDLEVRSDIQDKEIGLLTSSIRDGSHECGLYEVVRGTEPIRGRDAQIEILVDLERRPGIEREDGSIDFRDVNFSPDVRADQVVARRVPATKGTPGKDLKAKSLAAEDGEEQTLEAGDNVRVGREGEVEEFIANIDGAARLESGEISVVELLAVTGDVSFNTGNLSFGGEVCIDGSIVQGFTVKAGGSVTVTGTVEPGSTIIAEGDVTVGRGIVGQKTKIMAKQNVRAQFIQDATLLAGTDVTLGNFAYHARIQTGGGLTVERGSGGRGGSVMGGRILAREGIRGHTAGTPTGTTTTLVVGLEPGQAQQLDKLKKGIDTSHEHILRILRVFGLTRVDLGQIRNMIKATTGPRQKLLANRAQQLGQLAQAYQTLAGQRQELDKKISSAAEKAEITMADKAFPGVVVRVGEHQRTLEELVKAPRFHLVDGKLAER